VGKKKGDKQKDGPVSLSEMTREFVEGLKVKDERWERFYNYQPIPIYLREGGFWRTDKRVKAIIGANRTHKTYQACLESVIVFTGIIPKALQGVYPHEIPQNRPRHVRIIVQDYTKHWPEVIRPMLVGEDYGILPEGWDNWNESEKMFTGPDGSYLSILAVDPHEKDTLRVANRVRGAQIDHTMIDEINHMIVYTESLVRMAQVKDGPRTITLSFCPQEGYECWTYEELYCSGYDKRTKLPLPPDKLHPTIFAQQVRMRDNPNITPEVRAEICSGLKDWEIAFRVDGEYSQRAANPYFNMEMLIDWEQGRRCSDGIPVKMVEVDVSPDKGVFKGRMEMATDFDEQFEPVWRVWELPKHGEKYLVTSDSAEGNKQSDMNVSDVWKVTDPQKPVQVAQLRIRLIKPGEHAVQAACMANYYGDCLLVPERNTTAGGIFVERVRNYKNIYTQVKDVGDLDVKETTKLGWSTTNTTKGPMLETCYKRLQEFAAMGSEGEENWCPIKSAFTLHELMGYEERVVKRENGMKSTVVWGGRAGAHDDTVITCSIAMQIVTHEYEKISACILKKNVPVSHELSELEKKAAAASVGKRAFQKLRKKRSLKELRQARSRRRKKNGQSQSR